MLRRRWNLGSEEGNDAARLWKEESEHLKLQQNWLRVKTMSLDAFHIIRMLGTGPFGPVKLVKHKNTGNLYIMKAYHHLWEDQDVQMIRSLNNERTLLMEVNSVWVEMLFHSVQDSHFHFLLLEYIPGGSLADLLRQEGSFQENQTRFYGAEMLMAINVIHRYGFMHRNIQPSNFLIDHFGHLKIVDFITSLRFLPAETCMKMATEASIKDGKPFLSDDRRDRVKIYQRKTTNTKAGSVEFMAPEVVRKRPKGFLSFIQPVDPASTYSFAADFWSFGVCMYRLLFGQLPFKGKNKREISDKITNWRKTLSFPIVQPISDEAKDLIKKLLCDEPYRLGLNGCEEVMSHTFFDGTDWPRLRDWPVPVPFQPNSGENSDTSVGPPAIIADLFQPGNRATNNDKVSSGTLEPFLQDHLHSDVDPGVLAAGLPDPPKSASSQPGMSAPEPTRRIRGEPTSPNVSAQPNQDPVPGLPLVSAGSSAVDFTEESEDRVHDMPLDVCPWSPTPSTSQGQTSAGLDLSWLRPSVTSMNVSWSERLLESFPYEDLQRWMQSANFATRPSWDDFHPPPGETGSVVDAALRNLSSKDLRHLSKEKERLEKAGR